MALYLLFFLLTCTIQIYGLTLRFVRSTQTELDWTGLEFMKWSFEHTRLPAGVFAITVHELAEHQPS